MSGGYRSSSDCAPHTRQPVPPTRDPSRQPILSLTARQEDRLRIHVNERFRRLESDAQTGSFGSLPSLLARLVALLHIVLQIPPTLPWGSLRIDYLLTLTGYIPAYLTSLPLITASDPLERTSLENDSIEDGGDPRTDEDRGADTMRSLLLFTREVDRGWLAVLRGQAWVMDRSEGPGGGSVKVDFGAQVGATERIRLKSIVLSGRQRFLAWARTYGDFKGASMPGLAATPSSLGGSEQDEGDEGYEWEEEILRLWDGTLALLSDYEFEASG